MLSAEIVRPDALTQSDLGAWCAFCDERGLSSPLLSAEFAQAVGSARADVVVAVLKRHGRTVGFFPHHRRRDGFARPIGSPFSDYHTPILEPGRAWPLREILAASALRSFRYTNLLASPDIEAPAVSSSHAYAIDLSSTSATELLKRIRAADPKRAKNWRRLANKLERERAALSFGPDDGPEAFATVLSWKSAQLRRSGLHDVLRPAWVRRLFAELNAWATSDFGGLLLTLRVDGRPVAGHFGIRRRGVYHPWVAAFDPEAAAYSPGVLFLLQAIEAMPRLGLELYDLSAGSDHYKKPFANLRTPVRAGAVQVAASPPAGAPWMKRALGGRAAGFARRIDQRLDHIAAAEPSMLGRVRGVIEAMSDTRKRLGESAPDPA